MLKPSYFDQHRLPDLQTRDKLSHSESTQQKYMTQGHTKCHYKRPFIYSFLKNNEEVHLSLNLMHDIVSGEDQEAAQVGKVQEWMLQQFQFLSSAIEAQPRDIQLKYSLSLSVRVIASTSDDLTLI